MAKLQKYLFDVDFGARPPVPSERDAVVELAQGPEEAEPPPPTYSEEELALARQESFEAGRQAGLQAAAEGTKRVMATALTVMGEQLRGIESRQEAANERRLEAAVAVAVTVVRKLQPQMSRRSGVDEIIGVVEECLSYLDDDIRVTVRVNPDHLDAIRGPAQRVATAFAFPGKLAFAGDQRLEPGDCRVEWGDGGAERDQARIWAEIDGLIARATGAGQEAVADPLDSLALSPA
jgi:flagellar assembly protein FliH